MFRDYELIEIIENYAPFLGPENVDEICVLTDHEEWGEALIDLCTRLVENQVQIKYEDFKNLQAMATEMQMDVVELRMLERLVQH